MLNITYVTQTNLSTAKKTILLLLASLVLLLTTGAHAEYYTFVDSEGNIHYTDDPASLPSSVRKHARRVDAEMGPEKKDPMQPLISERDETEQGTRPAIKRAKKAGKPLRIVPMVGVPAAAFPPPVPPPANAGSLPPNSMTVRSPDPALGTPLMTLQYFRHSVASEDYSAAASCLGLVDAGEVRAYLSQLPKELAAMLSEESSPAVETVRNNDRAVYMIGDPRTGTSGVSRRYEVTLQRIEMNWIIMR